MKRVRYFSNLLMPDDPYEDYIVIEEFPLVHYTLIYRNTNFQPWIAAWNFDSESETWQQGHYFNTLRAAMAWINSKFKEEDDGNTLE